MTVACGCSNPTSGSVSLYYDGTNPLACDDTLAQYYGGGGNYPNAFEADFLWGACAIFNVPTLAALAQAIQENGGHLNNWLQISQTVIDDFANQFMTPNNETGVGFSTSDPLSADSINAAVAMWYLRQNLNTASSNYGYSGHNQLFAALNAYNSGTYSLDFTYAASVLWKGYGSQWASVSSTTYLGSYMGASPAGTQCRANTGNASDLQSLPTPGFSVSSAQYDVPFGSNSNGRRTIILVGPSAPIDYASGVIIEQWCYGSPYNEAYLTDDANVAAWSAHVSGNYCVICVGDPAINAIQNAAANYGITLESFSDFSQWDGSPNAGYINCNGSDALDSYNLGLAAAQQSASAGWA